MSVLCSDLSSNGKLNMFRDVLILPKLNEDFHSVGTKYGRNVIGIRNF